MLVKDATAQPRAQGAASQTAAASEAKIKSRILRGPSRAAHPATSICCAAPDILHAGLAPGSCCTALRMPDWMLFAWKVLASASYDFLTLACAHVHSASGTVVL